MTAYKYFISAALRIAYIFLLVNNAAINVLLHIKWLASDTFPLNKFLEMEYYGHFKTMMYWKIHFHKVYTNIVK